MQQGTFIRKQSGFTLVELVMVIVILGILAATAVPKFVDLSSNANDAAIKGVAGGLESASATNYAARVAGSTSFVSLSAAAACTQGVLGNLLQGGWPSGYSVSGSAACTTNGATGTCTITKDGTTPAVTATANIVCTQ